MSSCCGGRHQTGDFVSLSTSLISPLKARQRFPTSFLRRWCMVAGSSHGRVTAERLAAPTWSWERQLVHKVILLVRKRSGDLTDIWISHVTGLAPLVCRKINRSVFPQLPGMLKTERRVATPGGLAGGLAGRRGEDGICAEKHLGEVYEGKFLFVVMVTGSVVCSVAKTYP